MTSYSKSSNQDKVSALGLKEYMRKSHSRMQSLIKLSPTLSRGDSKKSIATNLRSNLSSLAPSKGEVAKSENIKNADMISEKIILPKVIQIFDIHLAGEERNCG